MTQDKLDAESLSKEVEMWRRWFLDYKLYRTQFKFIPVEDMNRIEAYFLCTPSSEMKDPQEVFETCLSTLLQFKKV